MSRLLEVLDEHMECVKALYPTYDVGDHVSFPVSVEAPEGFEVAKTVFGEWRLWSPKGSVVDIFVQDRKHGQEIGIVYEEGGSFTTKNAKIVDGVASFN